MKKRSLESQIKRSVKRKKKTNPINYINAGATLLNLTLGGGYPIGRAVNIAGEPSAGKTLLVLEMISYAIHKYKDDFVWKYDDVESGMMFDTKKLFDFDIPEGCLIHSDTVERFKFNFLRFLETIKGNQKAVYVVDSLDMLGSEASKKRSEEEMKAMSEDKKHDVGSYNLEKQKYLSANFFREVMNKAGEKNCTIIFVSQVRMNLDRMGPKFTRAGGKALDHQAAQVIWLKKTEAYKKKGITIGESIKVHITKNKVGKPFRHCFLNILYDYGLDNISTNVDYLFGLKTDTGKQRALKKGQEWNEGTFKKREELIRYVEENSLEKQLEEEVKAKWDQIEADIAPNRKSKYEES